MATMRAFQIDKPGGADDLRRIELAVPEPGPGQARVRVAYCGLNPLDIIVRSGGAAWMAPKWPIHYFHEPNYPQPRLHRDLDKGMAVSIGRLRKCPLLDWKFVLLSHNTVRGAAGGAILNAELMIKKGLV